MSYRWKSSTADLVHSLVEWVLGANTSFLDPILVSVPVPSVSTCLFISFLCHYEHLANLINSSLLTLLCLMLFLFVYREHTVFVSPPHPDDTITPPAMYSYQSFPDTLDYDLFPHREPPAVSSVGVVSSQIESKTTSFIARRSKAEVKAALKVCRLYSIHR